MFKDELKKRREEKGLTQEELADKLCVSRSAIAKWEQGRGVPSKQSFEDLTRFFNVSEQELLSTEEAVTEIDLGKKRSKRNKIIWISTASVLGAALISLITVFSVRDVQEKRAIQDYYSIKDNAFFSSETLGEFGVPNLPKVQDDGTATPFLASNGYYFNSNAKDFDAYCHRVYDEFAASPYISYLSSLIDKTERPDQDHPNPFPPTYLLPMTSWEEGWTRREDGKTPCHDYEFAFLDSSLTKDRQVGSKVTPKIVFLSYNGNPSLQFSMGNYDERTGKITNYHPYNCSIHLMKDSLAVTAYDHYLATEYFDDEKIEITNDNFSTYLEGSASLTSDSFFISGKEWFAASYLSVHFKVNYYLSSENSETTEHTSEWDVEMPGARGPKYSTGFFFYDSLPTGAYPAHASLDENDKIVGFYDFHLNHPGWVHRLTPKTKG